MNVKGGNRFEKEGLYRYQPIEESKVEFTRRSLRQNKGIHSIGRGSEKDEQIKKKCREIVSRHILN